MQNCLSLSFQIFNPTNICSHFTIYISLLALTLVLMNSPIQVIQMNIEESYRKLIAQELKINQSAQCPYVVVCYQSFYDNGVISIILEYMDGGSLLDFLKKVRTIPEPYLAAICKQVGNLNIIYLYEILSIANINSNMLFSCSSFLFIDAGAEGFAVSSS